MKRLLSLFCFALVLLWASTPVYAQSVKKSATPAPTAADDTCGIEGDDPSTYFIDHTPREIPGGRYVTTEEAKQLFDQGALFIDSRLPKKFAEQTINGAVNIPYYEQFSCTRLIGKQDRFDLSMLPPEKMKPLVFFCSGSPCWKGYKAARKAIEAGYQAVHWYRDGLPEWQRAGYPTSAGRQQP